MIYFIFNIISPIFRLEKVASPLFLHQHEFFRNKHGSKLQPMFDL